MSKTDYISFEKVHEEKKIQEAALSTLTAVLDQAMTEDDWCLATDLESEIQSQIDRMSLMSQDLRYLEIN